jgi:apolipoprotein D and lipocalin family protein
VKPVTGFDAKRYMGTWYELARIDHSFEKDLTQVSASYSLNDDGSVAVLNRGFDSVKQNGAKPRARLDSLGRQMWRL